MIFIKILGRYIFIGIILISMFLIIKKEDDRYIQNVISDLFIIRLPKVYKWLGVICSLFFTALFVLMFIFHNDTSELSIGIVFIVFILLGLFLVFVSNNWEVLVFRNYVIYRSTFGREFQFKYTEIKQVKLTQNSLKIKIDKKTFIIDPHAIGIELLLQRFNENNINIIAENRKMVIVKKVITSISIIGLIFIISFFISKYGESVSSNNQSNLNETEKVTVSIENDISIKINLEGWVYALEKEEMPSATKNFVDEIEADGFKFLLYGRSLEGNEAIRILAESADMENIDYLEGVQSANNEITNEKTQGESVEFGNTNGYFWTYTDINMPGWKYFEYLSKINKYNLRITMWTTEELFSKKEQNFKKILDSLEFN